MSSILKALEKAEESSSPKRLAGEALIRARKPRPVWVMPVAVLSGAVVATLITFAVMGGFSRHTPSAQAPALASRPAAEAVAVRPLVGTPPGAPAQVVPVQDPQIVPPAARAVTASKTARAAGRPAPPSAKTVVPASKAAALPATNTAQPSAKIRSVAGLHKKATQKAPPVAAVSSTPVPAVAPVAAAVPVHPGPKVSGIAWQNNGESSFAVVNGRAVLQGATVDGYKVLEIHQDRVRFSGSNGTFDVEVGGEE